MNYKKMLLPSILIVIFFVYEILSGFKLEFELFTLSMILLFSFLLIGITVFICFRKFSISLFIILCEFANIIEVLAISQILGIKTSLLLISSLFLILLYSINNNVFLTFKVLKETEKTAEYRKKEAMKTSLLITGTIILTLLALFSISFSFMTQIAPLLIIGFLFDFINTLFITGELITKSEVK